jgi:hypothetical protein
MVMMVMVMVMVMVMKKKFNHYNLHQAQVHLRQARVRKDEKFE